MGQILRWRDGGGGAFCGNPLVVLKKKLCQIKLVDETMPNTAGGHSFVDLISFFYIIRLIRKRRTYEDMYM